MTVSRQAAAVKNGGPRTRLTCSRSGWTATRHSRSDGTGVAPSSGEARTM
jgi:hypothetical protein